MAEKIKKCPWCGHIHDQYAMFCVNPECKNSLMSVQAVDESALEDTPSIENLPSENEARPFHQEVFEPSRESAPQVTQVLGARLECVDHPSMKLAVYNGYIAGRSGQIDLNGLNRSNYISREHVRFIKSGEEWQLENLSRTNPTLVNGQAIPVGGRYPLSAGAVITMADSKFTFRSVEDE
jgi:hypothetical protein